MGAEVWQGWLYHPTPGAKDLCPEWPAAMPMDVSTCVDASARGRAAMLLGRPVTDATALTKQYDFSLTFRTADTTLESGPGLGRNSWATAGVEARPTDLSAIEAVPGIFAGVQMLGLKLERNKLSKDRIVIDHIQKVPTSNWLIGRSANRAFLVTFRNRNE
jgi:uncharacterized protein (TIGR03435 family)